MINVQHLLAGPTDSPPVVSETPSSPEPESDFCSGIFDSFFCFASESKESSAPEGFGMETESVVEPDNDAEAEQDQVSPEDEGEAPAAAEVGSADTEAENNDEDESKRRRSSFLTNPFRRGSVQKTEDEGRRPSILFYNF